MKWKKVLSAGLTLICLGVFIYAAHGLISTWLDYSSNNRLVSDLQETFYDAAENEEAVAQADNDGAPRVRSGFDRLLEENEELVGWLTIDGTQIDYPILKADNNEEYLRHDFYKNWNILGSIFMDFRNDVTSFDKNTIVYGHRTKDGSMFEGLTKFQDKEFFDTHQTFTFDTLYESYEAEVFAVYNTTTDFNYIQTEFASEDDYGQLLSRMREESMFDTNVEVGTEDHILTLSTCDYELDEDEGRFVVHAKLVKKDSDSMHASK